MYCQQGNQYIAVKYNINASISFDVANNSMVMTYASVFHMVNNMQSTFINSTIT